MPNSLNLTTSFRLHRKLGTLWALLCVLMLVFTVTASAESSSQIMHTGNLPIGNIFPTPQGIVFPGLNIAAGVNPAALPRQIPSASLEAVFSPPAGTAGENEYFLSYANANQRFGWGAGYMGSYINSPTHSLFAGAGFRTQGFAIGLDLRDGDIPNGNLHTDLGVITDYSKDMSFAIVLYGLDSSPQMDVGLGFGRDKNYNFELNLLFPAFSGLFTPGSNFQLTAVSSVTISFLSLTFKSSYGSATAQISQTVSALIWFGKKFALTGQYASDEQRKQIGFIYNF